jgi:regulator of protease activity HflC (stomatin/prohibitin superfamily)
MTQHSQGNHDPNHPSTDEHVHRNPEVLVEPTDAANKALTDALHISFRILKGIMVVLVVLYLFSNVQCIDSSEQALVLRLGRLKPGVVDAGLVKAYPFPLEEILRLPTKKANESQIDSHNFYRKPSEVGKELEVLASARRPGQGLNPVLDGALLTADNGLVHVQWKVTYKFNDVRAYIENILGDELESAEALIKTIVETTGIHIASGMTAEQVTRTRVSDVKDEMKRRINQRLASLHSGLMVTLVEVDKVTPPLQIRGAFIATQNAENRKQRMIRDAERERTKLLNDTAGSACLPLLALLDRIDEAAREEDREALDALRAELDDFLESRIEGEAGELIKYARAYYAQVVGQVTSDVELYRTLIPEYERNPVLLIERLWETSRTSILGNPAVTKLYRPSGLGQLRVQIQRDPEQRRIDEARQLQKKKLETSSFLPEKLRTLGPDEN